MLKSQPWAGPPASRATKGDFTLRGRTTGADSPEQAPLRHRHPVPERAGYAPIIPDGDNSLCCGQSFVSKGLEADADRKSGELRPPPHEGQQQRRIPGGAERQRPASCGMKILPGRQRPQVVHDLVVRPRRPLLPRLMPHKKAEPVPVASQPAAPAAWVPRPL
ncbi:hypothetical protein [Zoogloea sp.]|uniref:hypothetical protein n=1 Tax=Zoogloea sp. TaxID=49181 RepID=UPI0025FFBF78|nr:hypothetical protein [Zoogloea sp.]